MSFVETSKINTQEDFASIVENIRSNPDDYRKMIAIKFRDPEIILKMIGMLSDLHADVVRYREWIENPE